MSERPDYEGKSKRVWTTPDPHIVRIEFKDDATASNGAMKASVQGKGVVNCAITTRIFEHLQEEGHPTHYIRRLSDTEILCRRVDIIPVEVVVRNVVAGSLSKRYGIPEGTPLATPLTEYFYKNDTLNDPLMTLGHAVAFGWATRQDLTTCSVYAARINRSLLSFWGDLGIDLIDFKVEFGHTQDGKIVLADEITPDGCRLWERGTGRHLDKDVFRRGLGDLGETYRELYQRMFA